MHLSPEQQEAAWEIYKLARRGKTTPLEAMRVLIAALTTMATMHHAHLRSKRPEDMLAASNDLAERVICAVDAWNDDLVSEGRELQ